MAARDFIAGSGNSGSGACVGGEDRSRMELDTFDGKVTMAQAMMVPSAARAEISSSAAGFSPRR